jgi:hypothetical protein
MDRTEPTHNNPSIYSNSPPGFWTDIKGVIILLVSKKMRPLIP